MDLKPERRYQTPGEMLEELNHVMKRLKAGDRGVHVSARDAGSIEGAEAAALASDSPVELEGDARTILLVESNVARQDAMREALKKRGYRVLVFSSPHRALQRFQEHVDAEPLADCVVFSAGELGDEAVDAFNALAAGEHTSQLPAILLANPENQARLQRAQLDERHISLPLNVKVKDLRATVLRLLRKEEPSSS